MFGVLKLCAKDSNKLKVEVRGQAAKDIEKYIVGTNYVSKHTIQRHIGGRCHSIAAELERLSVAPGSTATATGDTGSRPTPVLPASQPSIDTALHNQAREACVQEIIEDVVPLGCRWTTAVSL